MNTPANTAGPSALRLVLTLGQDGPAVAAVAKNAGIETLACVDLEAAVAAAHAQAVAGETVLLSPACSSLDMFKNYAERGGRFAGAVLSLPGGDA